MKYLLLLFIVSCAPKNVVCKGPVHANDARPDILVIGDSISAGYTPTLQNDLPNYDIVHIPCNGQDSKNGYNSIHYWLQLRPSWYAITFNHGSWDVSPTRGISGSDYAFFLREEARVIKAATPRPLFILTTKVPIHDTTRFVGSEVAYNRIATTIMNELGIPTVDLWTVSNQHPEWYQDEAAQNNVHFTPYGYEMLGTIIFYKLNSLL